MSIYTWGGGGGGINNQIVCYLTSSKYILKIERITESECMCVCSCVFLCVLDGDGSRMFASRA